MSTAAILVVEDDDPIASGLVRVLEGQGYPVHRVATGHAALAAVEARTRLVLLDLGLPDIDGIDVCRRMRASRPDLAILILTARDHELDVVAGLDAGADDYLVKPFKLSELLARVRAHMRRLSAEPDEAAEPIVVADLRIDRTARRAFHRDEELQLRPKEFDLLVLFTSEAGRVVTRDRIMREVWDTEWMGSTRTLDNHVLTLRAKLPGSTITTLRGIGYRYEG